MKDDDEAVIGKRRLLLKEEEDMAQTNPMLYFALHKSKQKFDQKNKAVTFKR